MKATTLTRRRPPWLRVKIHESDNYRDLKRLARGLHLTTVCEEARCPNIYECWGDHRTATFMLFGETCTRRCGFCAVHTGLPGPLDPDEPLHVAHGVRTLKLEHVVITAVTRDDLSDGGAAHFARTIDQVRQVNPQTRIEVLIPDLRGEAAHLDTVLAARPHILGHNIETVPRLYRQVRVGSKYTRSLELLKRAHGHRSLEYPLLTKTGIMCGLGESMDELSAVMDDLRAHDVQVLTLGQYLQPSRHHLPVARFYHPEEFETLRRLGLAKGFEHVQAGPLVRSSYHAHEHVPSMEV